MARCTGFRLVSLVAIVAALCVDARPRLTNATLTMSGISAGAAMAIQYQVAHSSRVRATGIIAGVPYFCAEADLDTALNCMSYPYTIELSPLNQQLSEYAAQGAIDPPQFLARQAVMLFSGTKDTVVPQGTMRALE